MIKALQRERFLVHDKVSGYYALGPTIMNLARVLLQRSDQDELVITVMPHMDRMRTITSETVGLHIPMGDLRLCVAELVSRQPIRTATGVGRTFPFPTGHPARFWWHGQTRGWKWQRPACRRRRPGGRTSRVC